jgi:hypothetical protein
VPAKNMSIVIQFKLECDDRTDIMPVFHVSDLSLASFFRNRLFS